MEIEKTIETKIEEYLKLNAYLDAVLAEITKLNQPVPSAMDFEEAFYLKLKLEVKDITEKRLQSEAARIRQQMSELVNEIRPLLPFENKWLHTRRWWVRYRRTNEGHYVLDVVDGNKVFR